MAATSRVLVPWSSKAFCELLCFRDCHRFLYLNDIVIVQTVVLGRSITTNIPNKKKVSDTRIGFIQSDQFMCQNGDQIRKKFHLSRIGHLLHRFIQPFLLFLRQVCDLDLRFRFFRFFLCRRSRRTRTHGGLVEWGAPGCEPKMTAGSAGEIRC